MAQLVFSLLPHTEGWWHETKISVLILLCFLMQQCDFIVFTTPLEGRQQWDLCSRNAAFPFIAFQVVFFFVLFSKLAIVFWFRAWRKALAVFVFKWWCFFLVIIQRWLFWGELNNSIWKYEGWPTKLQVGSEAAFSCHQLVHYWIEEKSIALLNLLMLPAL